VCSQWSLELIQLFLFILLLVVQFEDELVKVAFLL
jgi:hypothetical protein